MVKKIGQFDYSELVKQIKTKYQTLDKFADDLGIGRVSLSFRLNNKAQFKQEEIKKGAELLGIPDSMIPSYFFKQKVQKHEQKEGRINEYK